MATLRTAAIALSLVAAAGSHPLAAESLTVLGLNVESDADTDPREVATLIQRIDGVDIWGLSEVADDRTVLTFLNAAKSGETGQFRYFLGRSGRSDRLAVIYNRSKLELLETRELHYVQFERDGHRAALIGHFKQRATGRTFLFMVNHLARDPDDLRHRQAGLLYEFGRKEPEPVIAVGDYNFDWEVTGGENNHDPGFDRMTAGDVFQWVRPGELVDQV
jgi:endonuclease/exonuclease/phosphatase family metal-dependent hydrolase